MKKIKLVHLQLLPILSGVQIMMLNLLISLDRERYEIFVISKPGGELPDRVRELGFIHIPVGTLRRNISLYDIIAFVRLFIIFRKYKFDIVHTHSSKTGFLGRISARIAGVKAVIHTVHGFPFHEHQSKIAITLYRFLEKTASLFCDKIVVVNHYEREEAEKSGLIPADKMITIHNGIQVPEISHVRDYQETKNFILTSYEGKEITVSGFIVGSVARFTAAKNIVNLINIAVDVCRRSEDICFVFVGDGELFDRCLDIVNNNEMQHRIILTGWQSNVQYWLDKMDVFLLYSLWEGLSISILEAMASGLPVIASDIKGNNELITEDNGLLIDVTDHSKLAGTILSLPARKEDLGRWSKNSISRVKKMFSLEEFVKRYDDLYKSFIQ